MSPSFRKRGQGFLMLLLALPLATASSGSGEVQGAISAAELAVDPSPDACFFSMHFSGGDRREQWTYSFYGDGRVQIDRFNSRTATTPSSSWTTQLMRSEVESVRSELVEGNLIGLRPDEVMRRERQEGKVRMRSEDAGSATVTVSLLRQSPAGGVTRDAVSNNFVVDGSVFFPSAEAGPREFEALRRLMILGQEFQSRATEMAR